MPSCRKEDIWIGIYVLPVWRTPIMKPPCGEGSEGHLRLARCQQEGERAVYGIFLESTSAWLCVPIKILHKNITHYSIQNNNYLTLQNYGFNERNLNKIIPLTWAFTKLVS